MDTISWLLNLCVNHCRRFKNAVNTREKSKSKSLNPFAEFELNFHVQYVLQYESSPKSLALLSPIAILILSYFTKATVGGDYNVKGYELLDKLQASDADNTTTYLQAFDELEENGWIQYLSDRDNIFQVKPFVWMQSKVEYGETFHKLDGNELGGKNRFSSNDEFLERMFDYINELANKPSKKSIITSNTDIKFEADRAFSRILNIVENSNITLCSFDIYKNLKLSGWQYLYIIGLLAQHEKATDYDFEDIDDVVKLFAPSYAKRVTMRQHLIGDESILTKKRVIEGKEQSYGMTYKLTSSACRLLLGKKISSKSTTEMKKFITKHTIFEIDLPKIIAGNVQLPQSVSNDIQTILFSERKEGRKAREALLKILPAKIGTPIGTTVLLYGEAGCGKTLTAQYIASEMKVPLLKVDCSQVLGMFVGQSEKSVKRIFEEYEEIRSTFKMNPVLLLNEADQLLGDRNAGSNSIDKMHNNMQNLFLEGLEKFQGILIATTNKKGLLDAAYSRRFTYKIELPKPDYELRCKIWQNHIPKQSIAEEIDYKQLSQLNLTGGEIRIVMEQAIRSAAYKGNKKLDNNTIYELAKKEALIDHDKKDKVYGFIL